VFFAEVVQDTSETRCPHVARCLRVVFALRDRFQHVHAGQVCRMPFSVGRDEGFGRVVEMAVPVAPFDGFEVDAEDGRDRFPAPLFFGWAMSFCASSYA